MSDWRSDTKSKGNELDRVIKIGDRLGKIIVQSLEARTDFKTENRGTSWVMGYMREMRARPRQRWVNIGT